MVNLQGNVLSYSTSVHMAPLKDCFPATLYFGMVNKGILSSLGTGLLLLVPTKISTYRRKQVKSWLCGACLKSQHSEAEAGGLGVRGHRSLRTALATRDSLKKRRKIKQAKNINRLFCPHSNLKRNTLFTQKPRTYLRIMDWVIGRTSDRLYILKKFPQSYLEGNLHFTTNWQHESYGNTKLKSFILPYRHPYVLAVRNRVDE